jgi:lysophospholipase L1-like esterase
VSGRPGPGRGKSVAFAAIALILFFGGLEVGLRVLHVGEDPVGTLRFGYDTGIPVFDTDGVLREGTFHEYPLFGPDPVLFWRPLEDTPFTGTDGLRKPVPASRGKPPGDVRLGVLGDSCSFLGETPYPEILARLLEERLGRPVDVVNASCPGYTSTQGRARLDEVLAWRPDVLLVYFGWNDHWNSLNGMTDSELMRRRERRRGLLGPLRRLRLVRGLESLLRPAAGGPARTVRVPPDEYRENLEAIAEGAAGRGARVVWITAPTALSRSAMPEWASEFWGRFYEMTREEVENIPVAHARYNDIVREVARESGGLLVDLAAEWAPAASDPRFRRDGIHLTAAGHRAAAAAALEAMEERRTSE